MIKQFNVEKALRDYLKSIATLSVYGWDDDYSPQATDSYILEKPMLGNVSITLSPGDSENANGLYQIDVYTPLASKSKWYGLQLRDDLKAQFTKGLTAGIEQDGQKVIVNNVNTPPMRVNDTHRVHTLDVNFRCIG